jgi:D-hexose-6-phosphate mutarotase
LAERLRWFRAAVANVSVKGLGAVDYLDNCNQRVKCNDGVECVKIEKETDRIYLAAPDSITVRQPARTATPRFSGFHEMYNK